MSKFRKIYATEGIYKQTKMRFLDVYEDFIKFNLAIQDKEKVTRGSGKPRSYASYLIRLIVLYEDIFKDRIEDVTTFNAIKKIEQLRVRYPHEFKSYNKGEGHFPSASLNSYTAYITQLRNLAEEMLDNDLNYEINSSGFDEHIVEEALQLMEGPQKRKPKKKIDALYVYPRNPMVIYKAKIRSNWQCEFNNQHETFTSIANKKPYLDAHHLIPMATQDYYDNTIDFTDNVVCLCPTCHSRIHHAIIPQKLEMIEVLYDKRKDLYQRHEIDINKQKLESYYGIF